MRLRHLEEIPHDCKAVKVYEGSRENYWIFLTPKASKALDHYLNFRTLNGEKLTLESPLFSNSEKPHNMKKNLHMSEKSAKQMMQRLIRTAGVERIKQGNRCDKTSIYGFRKRFNIILKLDKNINPNIAEKLMGHKKGLDGAYLKPTRDECFNEFVKTIPNLTISDEYRDKFKIQNLEQEKSEHEKLTKRIDHLEDAVSLAERFQRATKEHYEECFKKLQQMNPKMIEEVGFETAKNIAEVTVMVRGWRKLKVSDSN